MTWNVRERNREAIPAASGRYHQKRRIKQKYLGVARLLFAYFPPATSIDRLHQHEDVSVNVGGSHQGQV